MAIETRIRAADLKELHLDISNRQKKPLPVNLQYRVRGNWLTVSEANHRKFQRQGKAHGSEGWTAQLDRTLLAPIVRNFDDKEEQILEIKSSEVVIRHGSFRVMIPEREFPRNSRHRGTPTPRNTLHLHECTAFRRTGARYPSKT